MQDNYLPNIRNEVGDLSPLIERLLRYTTPEGVISTLDIELRYYDIDTQTLFIFQLAHELKPYCQKGFPFNEILEWTREKTWLIGERAKKVKPFKDKLSILELTRLKDRINEKKNSNDEKEKLMLPLLEIQLEIHNRNSSLTNREEIIRMHYLREGKVLEYSYSLERYANDRGKSFKQLKKFKNGIVDKGKTNSPAKRNELKNVKNNLSEYPLIQKAIENDISKLPDDE